MDIGKFCGFRYTRVDNNQQFIRIFRKALKLPRRLGNLMALHAVPSECQKNFSIIDIRLVMQILLSVSPPYNPESAGKFLRQCAVLILRTEQAHQADAESRLKMAALAAAPHVSE